MLAIENISRHLRFLILPGRFYTASRLSTHGANTAGASTVSPMPRPSDRKRTQRETPTPNRTTWARLAALCTATALLTGCQWYSMTPKERVGPLPATAARTLNTLVLGDPRSAVLNCARKECNHWYRLDIARPGMLDVEVETEPKAARPMVRLILREMGRAPLAQTMGGTNPTLSVRAPVGKGLYMVLVQAGGGRLPYTVTATLEADPR